MYWLKWENELNCLPNQSQKYRVKLKNIYQQVWSFLVGCKILCPLSTFLPRVNPLLNVKSFQILSLDFLKHHYGRSWSEFVLITLNKHRNMVKIQSCKVSRIFSKSALSRILWNMVLRTRHTYKRNGQITFFAYFWKGRNFQDIACDDIT